jgi:hypothetical protein
VLSRARVVATLVLVALFGSSIPALANIYGNVDCSQSPTPDCQLGAGSSGQGRGRTDGHRHGRHRAGQGNSSAQGHSGTGVNGDTIVGGGKGLANCSYVRSGYHPPAGVVTVDYRRSSFSKKNSARLVAFTYPEPGGALVARPVAAPAPGQQEAWYVWTCTTAGVADGLYHPPVFVPNGQAAPNAAGLLSAVQVAELARKQLRFPTPRIGANPVGEQLVDLPTWLWLTDGWDRMSATAAVPGVSVTAVATPVAVSWSMGDGARVTCSGAGTPFRAGDNPAAASPDCGHTYHASSASQAGQAFPVTATVRWRITWAGAGQRGVFPDLTTTGNAAFRVAESQALDNGG